jgi:hypothetical protein
MGMPGFDARLNRSRLRFSGSGAGRDEEGEQADIGADVDEGERPSSGFRPVDLRRQFPPFGGFIHLRCEQRALLTAVAARVQAHAPSPPDHVESVVAGHPHRHDAPQGNGEPQSEPVVRQTARDGDDGPVERRRKPRAIRLRAIGDAPVFRRDANFVYGAEVLIAHVKIAV